MDAIQPTFDPARDYPKWTADCSTCKAIWYQFTHPDSAPEVSLGFYDEALSPICPNHKFLVETFIAYIRSKGIDEERYNIGDLGLYKRGGFHRGVSLLASISKSGQGWKLLLLNKPDVPNHPGNGRILGPDWADVEAVKGWKHKCISSHGAKCQNLLKVSSARPAWLVDVQNQCIVSGDESSSYVALSYTYGSHTQPKITSEDFKMLQQPFALANTTFSAYISPIIRHAMYLTSTIDERYLWADALCVTHHDPKAASEQLETMGTIYANAVVTIIAVDGDSQSGIPGLKGVSNPRGIQQETIPFGDETILLRNTDINSMGRVGSNYYHNRGWTFQEYSFSSRKIVLLDREMHWMCACTTWHEEVTLYTEIDHIFRYQFDLLTAGLPADFCLTQYAMDYNQRFLTFQEDALPAISGLLSVLSRSFEEGFLYGIPEMFFEHSLGWWGMDMVRRVSSDRPTASTPPSMPDQTQYLFCETYQTTLPCYRADSPNLILRTNICDQSRKVIGRLGVVNKESWMRFPKEGDGTETGLQVDLVAICKLKRYTKPKEIFVAVDLPQTTEALYSVLWVEWKDGIAYRLASGEVIADEWEKLDLKKISLILG